MCFPLKLWFLWRFSAARHLVFRTLYLLWVFRGIPQVILEFYTSTLNSQQRICWGSISGTGEWLQENARTEKPEQPWNLPGTFLERTLLEGCWNWNLPGTLLKLFWNCWNCAGTLLEPSCVHGILLDLCWNCVAPVLEPSWTLLELCWNLPGTMLKLLCFHFGYGAYRVLSFYFLFWTLLCFNDYSFA